MCDSWPFPHVHCYTRLTGRAADGEEYLLRTGSYTGRDPGVDLDQSLDAARGFPCVEDIRRCDRHSAYGYPDGKNGRRQRQRGRIDCPGDTGGSSQALAGSEDLDHVPDQLRIAGRVHGPILIEDGALPRAGLTQREDGRRSLDYPQLQGGGRDTIISNCSGGRGVSDDLRSA